MMSRRKIVLSAGLLLVLLVGAAILFQLIAQRRSQSEQSPTAEGPFRMRSSGWDAQTDAINKSAGIYVPLEDKSKAFSGVISINCRAARPASVTLSVLLSKRYRVLTTDGITDVTFLFAENNGNGFAIPGRVSFGTDDNAVLTVRGFSGAGRSSDDYKQAINELSIMQVIVRRLHNDKNIYLKISDREGGKGQLSILQPTPLHDQNQKLFESVAAFCIDVLK